jgi:hypothetical protein
MVTAFPLYGDILQTIARLEDHPSGIVKVARFKSIGLSVLVATKPGVPMEKVRRWAFGVAPHAGFEPGSTNGVISTFEKAVQSPGDFFERLNVEGLVGLPIVHRGHYVENSGWQRTGSFTKWMADHKRPISGQIAFSLPIRSAVSDVGVESAVAETLLLKVILDLFDPVEILEFHDAIAYPGWYGFASAGADDVILKQFLNDLRQLSNAHDFPLYAGPAEMPWMQTVGDDDESPLYRSWASADEIAYYLQRELDEPGWEMPQGLRTRGDNVYGYLKSKRPDGGFAHVLLEAPYFLPQDLYGEELPAWLIDLIPNSVDQARLGLREFLTEDLIPGELLDFLRIEADKDKTPLGREASTVINTGLVGSNGVNAFIDKRLSGNISPQVGFRCQYFSAMNAAALVAASVIPWARMHFRNEARKGIEVVNRLRDGVNNVTDEVKRVGQIRDLTRFDVDATVFLHRDMVLQFGERCRSFVAEVSDDRRPGVSMDLLARRFKEECEKSIQARRSAGMDRETEPEVSFTALVSGVSLRSKPFEWADGFQRSRAYETASGQLRRLVNNRYQLIQQCLASQPDLFEVIGVPAGIGLSDLEAMDLLALGDRLSECLIDAIEGWMPDDVALELLRDVVRERYIDLRYSPDGPPPTAPETTLDLPELE